MGLMLVDHRHPGSNVALAAEDPARCTRSSRPWSKDRLSSGLSNDLLEKSPMIPPFPWSAGESTTPRHEGQCLGADLGLSPRKMRPWLRGKGFLGLSFRRRGWPRRGRLSEGEGVLPGRRLGPSGPDLAVMHQHGNLLN